MSMEEHDITYYIIRYSYLGVFLWFLIMDQLTPIPEEVVLLTVGYLSHTDKVNPLFAGLAASLGLMIVDNLYYYMAFTGNKWTRNLQRQKRMLIFSKFQESLQKHKVKTLLMIAFIPKVRFFGPILAGLSKLPYRQFFFINLTGTAVYVLFYLTLGFYFHHAMELLIQKVEFYHHAIFIFFVIIVGASISFWVRRFLSKDQKGTGVG